MFGGSIVPFLIIFPLVVALLMLVIPVNEKANKVRRTIAYTSCILIMAGVCALVFDWCIGGFKPISLFPNTLVCDHLTLYAEVALAVVVTYLSFKYRRAWVSLLSIVPTVAIGWLDLFGPKTRIMDETPRIYIDHLTILMCIIIGIIGSLIIIYAVGYMHGYHHYSHAHVKDRRNYFFMVLFLFIGARLGFVLTDSITCIQHY